MSHQVEDLSEFHHELRGVARELLAKADPAAGPGWGSMVRAGWTELEVPVPFGGAGGTFAETAVVLTESGRAAARTPYASVALSVAALGLLEPGEGRDRLFTETAEGTVIPIVALGGVGIEASPFVVSPTSDGFVLDGIAEFVADAPGADRLLVLAHEQDGRPAVVSLDPRTAGLHISDTPVLDETRRFGTVQAEAVAVSPGLVWRFSGDANAAAATLRLRAESALACDSLGLAEAMLDATVEYCGVREQFGRKIGSFQAVKHACADMLVSVTVARKLVAAAVRGVAGGRGDDRAVSMAKSYACSAAVDIAGKAMQLHGGIGYTWESGIHTYLKRATLNRSLHGSTADHRRRVALRYSEFTPTTIASAAGRS